MNVVYQSSIYHTGDVVYLSHLSNVEYVSRLSNLVYVSNVAYVSIIFVLVLSIHQRQI